MTTDNKTYDRVRDTLVNLKGLPVEKVTLDATWTDLDLDSLDVIEIVMAVEDEFSIEITDDETPDMDERVSDLVKLIEGKRTDG
jgi:acyl carrier protein